MEETAAGMRPRRDGPSHRRRRRTQSADPTQGRNGGAEVVRHPHTHHLLREVDVHLLSLRHPREISRWNWVGIPGRIHSANPATNNNSPLYKHKMSSTVRGAQGTTRDGVQQLAHSPPSPFISRRLRPASAHHTCRSPSPTRRRSASAQRKGQVGAPADMSSPDTDSRMVYRGPSSHLSPASRPGTAAGRMEGSSVGDSIGFGHPTSPPSIPSPSRSPPVAAPVLGTPYDMSPSRRGGSPPRSPPPESPPPLSSAANHTIPRVRPKSAGFPRLETPVMTTRPWVEEEQHMAPSLTDLSALRKGTKTVSRWGQPNPQAPRGGAGGDAGFVQAAKSKWACAQLPFINSNRLNFRSELGTHWEEEEEDIDPSGELLLSSTANSGIPAAPRVCIRYNLAGASPSRSSKKNPSPESSPSRRFHSTKSAGMIRREEYVAHRASAIQDAAEEASPPVVFPGSAGSGLSRVQELRKRAQHGRRFSEFRISVGGDASSILADFNPDGAMSKSPLSAGLHPVPSPSPSAQSSTSPFSESIPKRIPGQRRPSVTFTGVSSKSGGQPSPLLRKSSSNALLKAERFDVRQYLPLTVNQLLQSILESGQRLEDKTRIRMWGFVMLVDISGFTRMAETLCSEGSRGVETLMSIINRYFSTLIGIVTENGGDVLYFVGDALVVLFSLPLVGNPAVSSTSMNGESESEQQMENKSRLALQVTKCAAQLMQDAGTFSHDSIELCLHIGLSAGDIWCGLIGGFAGKFKYLFSGSVFETLNRTVSLSESGEVVVCQFTRTLLAAALTNFPAEAANAGVLGVKGPFREGKLVVGALNPADPTNVWKLVFTGHSIEHRASASGPPLLHSLTHDQEEAFVLPFINSFVASFYHRHKRVIPELRNLTVVFVSYTSDPTFSMEEDGSERFGEISQAVSSTQDIVSSLGGVFSNFFVDEKGVGALIVFGLTAESGEEQQKRGVIAASQIAQTINNLDLDGSVGVNCGQCYSGPVGSRTRSDFTLLGDVVNTAARLMANARKKAPAPRGKSWYDNPIMSSFFGLMKREKSQGTVAASLVSAKSSSAIAGTSSPNLNRQVSVRGKAFLPILVGESIIKAEGGKDLNSDLFMLHPDPVPLHLKGKEAPVNCFQVTEATNKFIVDRTFSAGKSSASLLNLSLSQGHLTGLDVDLSSIIVGRENELKKLGDLLERVSRRGSMVAGKKSSRIGGTLPPVIAVLAGRAGTGKSYVLQHFLDSPLSRPTKINRSVSFKRSQSELPDEFSGSLSDLLQGMDILGEADQGPGAEGGVSGEVDLAKAPSKSALISATSMRNVRVSRKGLHKRHVTSIDWKEQEIPFVLCLSDSIQSGSAFSCWRGAFTSLISTAKAKSRTNRTGTTGDKGASKLDIITNVLEGGGVCCYGSLLNRLLDMRFPETSECMDLTEEEQDDFRVRIALFLLESLLWLVFDSHGYVILGMENIHRMDPQSRHLLKLYCDTGAEALAHMIPRCPFPTLIIACLRTTLYGGAQSVPEPASREDGEGAESKTSPRADDLIMAQVVEIMGLTRRHREVELLPMHQLSRQEVESFAARSVKAKFTASDVADVLMRCTKGHPGRLSQIIRALLDAHNVLIRSGDVCKFQRNGRTRVLEVLHSLEGLLDKQYDFLEGEQQEFLKLASVLDEFEPALVRYLHNKLAPAPARLTTSQVQAMIDQLLSTGLLQKLPEFSIVNGEEKYEFEHATTAFILYHQMLPSRRTEIHRLAFSWLKQAMMNPSYISHPNIKVPFEDRVQMMLGQLAVHGYRYLSGQKSVSSGPNSATSSRANSPRTGGRSSPPAANHNVGADEQAAHRQKVIEVVGFMEEHAKHKMSQQQYRDAVELFDDALQLLLSCKNVDRDLEIRWFQFQIHKRLADCHMYLGYRQEAESGYQTALAVLPREDSDFPAFKYDILRSLWVLFLDSDRSTQRAELRRVFEEIADVLPILKDDFRMLDAYRISVKHHCFQGYPTSSQEVFEQFQKKYNFRQHSNILSLYDCGVDPALEVFLLASVNNLHLGSLDKAARLWQKCTQIFERLTDIASQLVYFQWSMYILWTLKDINRLRLVASDALAFATSRHCGTAVVAKMTFWGQLADYYFFKNSDQSSFVVMETLAVPGSHGPAAPSRPLSSSKSHVDCIHAMQASLNTFKPAPGEMVFPLVVLLCSEGFYDESFFLCMEILEHSKSFGHQQLPLCMYYNMLALAQYRKIRKLITPTGTSEVQKLAPESQWKDCIMLYMLAFRESQELNLLRELTRSANGVLSVWGAYNMCFEGWRAQGAVHGQAGSSGPVSTETMKEPYRFLSEVKAVGVVRAATKELPVQIQGQMRIATTLVKQQHPKPAPPEERAVEWRNLVLLLDEHLGQSMEEIGALPSSGSMSGFSRGGSSDSDLQLALVEEDGAEIGNVSSKLPSPDALSVSATSPMDQQHQHPGTPDSALRSPVLGSSPGSPALEKMALGGMVAANTGNLGAGSGIHSSRLTSHRLERNNTSGSGGVGVGFSLGAAHPRSNIHRAGSSNAVTAAKRSSPLSASSPSSGNLGLAAAQKILAGQQQLSSRKASGRFSSKANNSARSSDGAGSLRGWSAHPLSPPS